jgi:hypothetical protein
MIVVGVIEEVGLVRSARRRMTAGCRRSMTNTSWLRSAKKLPSL